MIARQYSNFIISIMLLGETKYPSSQEINFELTQNTINSPQHKRRVPDMSRLSLQYTLSQISIENELEDQVPNFLDHLPYSSLKDKECGYITTSTRHTLASAKTTLQTIRIRTQSCKQHASLQKIKATIAICPIFFDQSENKEMQSHRKRNSKEKFRLRKSVSVRERKNSENMPNSCNRFVQEFKEVQIAKKKILQPSFKVQTISLQQNEGRGKIYMKKLIQNRASILHLSEISHESPWDTKRMTFRT